jgi:hypothetical protein
MITMVLQYTLPILLLLSPLLCRAAFNNASDPDWCWAANCVAEKKPGLVCYYPAGNQTLATACTGGHYLDTGHQAVVNAHLAQSWSIAYYALLTNEHLGGTNYSLAANLAGYPNQTITVCLSGQIGNNNAWQTLCAPANFDNDITYPGAYCQVALGQHYVSDGCYTAMPNSTTPGPPSG